MRESEKNILILSSLFPTKSRPNLGNFVQYHAAVLANDHKVTMLTYEVSSEVKKMEVQVSFIKLPGFSNEDSSGFQEIRVFYPGSKLRLGNFLRKRIAFLYGLTQVKKTDTIHAHFLLNNGRWFVKAARQLGVPIWLIENDSNLRDWSKLGWRRRFIARKVVEAASKRITVSVFFNRDLRRESNHDWEVLGNPVSSRFFTVQNTRRLDKKFGDRSTLKLLHISTLHPIKNVEEIIRAIEKGVKAGHVNWRLTIVCDEDFSVMNQLVKELQLWNFVEFRSSIPNEDLPNIYVDHDALIMASDYETFSIVIAEALATDTPIISTRVGIAAELSDNTLVSINKPTAEEIAKAILDFEQNARSMDGMREFSLKYSAEKIRERYKFYIEKSGI